VSEQLREAFRELKQRQLDAGRRISDAINLVIDELQQETGLGFDVTVGRVEVTKLGDEHEKFLFVARVDVSDRSV